MSSNNEVCITEETTVQHFAEVVINGRSLGKQKVNGSPSIKEFALNLAKEHGIRSFTVTLDNAPVTTAQANDPLPSGSAVGVQAKDARGSEPVSQADGLVDEAEYEDLSTAPDATTEATGGDEEEDEAAA